MASDQHPSEHAAHQSRCDSGWVGSVIREDRELLAELARLNTAMASLAMRMMDGSASAAEQHDYAQRLIAAGERMRKRADKTVVMVVEGEVLRNRSLVFPPLIVSDVDGLRKTTSSTERHQE